MANTEKKISLDQLQSWAKRRGFIYPSSEIYGNFAAVYDYGPYGVLLKNNIQQLWWRTMVLERDDVVGLDSAIFMHPKTWHASGHVDSFAEPLIDCKNCKARIRADHLLEKFGYDLDKAPMAEVNEAIAKLKAEGKLKCDNCGSTDLTEARAFNNLVQTNLGSFLGTLKDLAPEDVVYARGETCQGIYLNFKNVIDTTKVRLPFGIAQVGKAFRNEIVARQYIFRTREFEQMEMQYFLHPDDMQVKFDYWKEERMRWYIEELKINPERLHFKKHVKLAHYAKEAYDIEFDYQCLGGFKEVEGIHQRGDWDLSRHQQFSGTDLSYTDPKRNERYLPNIMETSAGLNRMVLMVIDQGYTEEDLGEGKSRVVMKFKPSIAPIKVAVFPLQKDEKLQGKAREIYLELKKHITAEFDDSGNIGKMYRRQDEIGTPWCVTVDYETLEDAKVTIRDRDTMQQERVAVNDLAEYILGKLQ